MALRVKVHVELTSKGQGILGCDKKRQMYRLYLLYALCVTSDGGLGSAGILSRVKRDPV